LPAANDSGQLKDEVVESIFSPSLCDWLKEALCPIPL